MLASWTIELQGQNYEVTVSRTENGKDVIRVNGRVAAKPLDANESERTIIIGSRHYVVARDHNGEYLMTPFAPELDTTLIAQELTPTAATESWFNMKVVYAGTILLFGIILVGGIASGTSYKKHAAQRVNQVLTEMKQGTGPEAELAVTLWAKNRRHLDREELSWASDHFDKWRREKDLYRKFGEHKILDSEEVKGAEVPTVIVRLSIEDHEYKVRVPKDLPISWE